MSDNELIWVSPELAKRYKDATGTDKDNIVLEYINSCREDIKNNLANMDEDVLYFRGMMAKARKDFREAKDAELQSFYEIWEKFDTDISNVNKKVQGAKEKIEPLRKEISQLSDELSKVHQLNRALTELKENIYTVSTMLSPYSAEAKLLHFVLHNYATVKENKDGEVKS